MTADRENLPGEIAGRARQLEDRRTGILKRFGS